MRRDEESRVGYDSLLLVGADVDGGVTVMVMVMLCAFLGRTIGENRLVLAGSVMSCLFLSVRMFTGTMSRCL